ncbi:MAG: hypothetical protein H8D97_01665 [Proteobacteria bacterium]|nr:hypothetical protein [Pseudomonadota bacterium]
MAIYPIAKFKVLIERSKTKVERLSLLKQFYVVCTDLEIISSLFNCSQQQVKDGLILLDLYKKKFCNKCGNWRLFSEFGKDKYKKSGLVSQCKYCREEKRNNTREYQREYSKKHYIENKEKKSIQSKTRYDNNKEEILSKRKLYREENKELLSARQKEKRENDNAFRFKDSLSSLIRHSLDKGGKSVNDILPYIIKELRGHLELQFVDGMNWNNYGKEWHLDHIRPVNSFENQHVQGHLDFIKCWGLDNLQPLWKDLNLEKADKWDGTDNNESIKLQYINNNR